VLGKKLDQLATQVSVPADSRGGDAVAEELPSGLHDALSVRTFRLRLVEG
jgi:hypothetical protein